MPKNILGWLFLGSKIKMRRPRFEIPILKRFSGQSVFAFLSNFLKKFEWQRPIITTILPAHHPKYISASFLLSLFFFSSFLSILSALFTASGFIISPNLLSYSFITLENITKKFFA